MTEHIVTLRSNISINYPKELDGGGVSQRHDFIKVLGLVGKQKYQNCFEWCAGFGGIGYEILGHDLCEKLHFSDCYRPAIENLRETAIKNNLSNKVNVYLSDTIQKIPVTELFDLVVANPPHRPDKDGFLNYLIEAHGYKNLDDLMASNLRFWVDAWLRLIVDDGMKIHEEFFRNIKNKITPDSDIFLSEVSYGDELQNMVSKNGFVLVEKYKVDSFNGYILHFKVGGIK
jgi:methylase of polypeptide subunit release factors